MHVHRVLRPFECAGTYQEILAAWMFSRETTRTASPPAATFTASILAVTEAAGEREREVVS